MKLEELRDVYEGLGEDDPLWAVLTADRYRDNRWDPEAFFASGRTEITEVVGYLERLGRSPEGGRVLDFGCGVGRLSLALAEHFDDVTGVDISTSMLERARDFNRFGDRVRFVHNDRADLEVLGDARFDLVYSNKTLQHIAPRFSLAYVAEFLRLLAPGGVALFMIPAGPHRAGSWSRRWYRLWSERLRPGLKQLRGRPRVEMHSVSPREVAETVEAAGGRIVDRVDQSPRRRRRKRMRYCAVVEG